MTIHRLYGYRRSFCVRAVILAVCFCVVLGSVPVVRAFPSPATVSEVARDSWTVITGGAAASGAARIVYSGVARWLPVTLQGVELATLAAGAIYVGAAVGIGYLIYHDYFADRSLPSDPDSTIVSDAQGVLVVESLGLPSTASADWSYTESQNRILHGYYSDRDAAVAAAIAYNNSRNADLGGGSECLWSYAFDGSDETLAWNYAAYDMATCTDHPYERTIWAFPADPTATTILQRPVAAGDLADVLTYDIAVGAPSSGGVSMDDLMDQSLDVLDSGLADPAGAVGSDPNWIPDVYDPLNLAVNDPVTNPDVDAFKSEVDASSPSSVATQVGASRTRTRITNATEITAPITERLDDLPGKIGDQLSVAAQEANDSVTLPGQPGYDSSVVPVSETDAVGLFDSLYARLQATALVQRLSLSLTASGSPDVDGVVTVAGHPLSIHFSLDWAAGALATAGNLFLALVVVRETWSLFR